MVVREAADPLALAGAPLEGPAADLRFRPRIDLQVRNSSSAAADGSIRGGIFTQTGFRAGAAGLIDSQTGHYRSEIPVAPLFFSPPLVLSGFESARSGFNATAGSIAYGWSPVGTGCSLDAGWGDRGYNSQHLAAGGLVRPRGFLSGAVDRGGFDLDLARAVGDGTRPNGDFDFQRYGTRLQLLAGDCQTDLFAGYGDKFFGWPDMYTPEDYLPTAETERVRTSLVFLNHRRGQQEDNFLELSAYYRRNNDHYVLQREDPAFYEAFHRTSVWSAAAAGRRDLGTVALVCSGQVAADRLASTAITDSPYYSRTDARIALAPEKAFPLTRDLDLILSAGAGLDLSNRADSCLSPLAGAELIGRHGEGEDRYFLRYGASSQLPDYTALGSPPGGLFGGNPDLGREQSRTVEGGLALAREGWRLEGTIFYRADRDLVDWTYREDAVNARTANAVDLDTRGVQLVFARAWRNLRIRAAYAWLEKSHRYRDPQAEASFYALNYPRRRGLLSVAWIFLEGLEFRLENEYRRQRTNPLRSGREEAVLTSAGLAFLPPGLPDLEGVISLDNPFKVSFQEIPGVPGPGRQVILRAAYRY